MKTITSLKVTLLTGRTIEQGVGKEQGKMSEEYYDSVSVCFIDPKDLKRLEVKDRELVRITTDFGSVVLTGLKSPQAPHPGTVFVPYGPWANVVVDPETDSIGMPSLKGIKAQIEPCPDGHVFSLDELLNEQFGKK